MKMVYRTIIIHRFIELIMKLVLVVSTQAKFNMLFFCPYSATVVRSPPSLITEYHCPLQDVYYSTVCKLLMC